MYQSSEGEIPSAYCHSSLWRRRFSDIHFSQTLTPLSLHPLAFQLANVQPLLGILVSNVLSSSQRF